MLLLKSVHAISVRFQRTGQAFRHKHKVNLLKASDKGSQLFSGEPPSQKEGSHDACVSAWKDSRSVAVAFLCLRPASLREGELIKRGACRWSLLVFMAPGGHAKEQRAKEVDHTQQETKGHKTTPVTDSLQQETVIKQERRVWMAGGVLVQGTGRFKRRDFNSVLG